MISTAVVPPSSCKDLGNRESGQYTLNLGDNDGEFYVYCDMDADLLGGGWTIIQRRGPDADADYFNKDWKSYKNGFGTFHGSFWLGLEKIHRITSSDNYQLYIGMQATWGREAWARFSTFRVGDEASQYTLTVDGYDSEGTAGNSLHDHSGLKFSTFDRNNDRSSSEVCSQQRSGGWWFDGCHDANLNGRYYPDGVSRDRDGISWHQWLQSTVSMVRVVMAIKPA